jgi:hypothetical protein
LNYPINAGAFPLNLPYGANAQQENPQSLLDISSKIQRDSNYRIMTAMNSFAINPPMEDNRRLSFLPSLLIDLTINSYHALAAN